MKQKTLHTTFNLLLEAELYQRLRMVGKLKKICMSKLVRDGIRLKLDQIDKKNGAITEDKADE